MFIIGITGGIGTGKSTVASICREAGLPVIDADEISHAVTRQNGAALPAIEARFGREFIDSQEGLRREKMAELVFHDKQALDELGQIVHREVLAEVNRRLKDYEEAGCKALVMDFPIPLEKGFSDVCDFIMTVWAEDHLRLHRLAERGLDPEAAKQRMAVQMSREEYAARADIEIVNNQDFATLQDRVLEILMRELGDRGIRLPGR